MLIKRGSLSTRRTERTWGRGSDCDTATFPVRGGSTGFYTPKVDVFCKILDVYNCILTLIESKSTSVSGVNSTWSSVHMTYARKSSLSRRWSLYTTRLSFPYPNGTRTDWTRMDTAKTTHDIFVGFAQILAHHCTPVQAFNLVPRVITLIILWTKLMAPMADPKTLSIQCLDVTT